MYMCPCDHIGVRELLGVLSVVEGGSLVLLLHSALHLGLLTNSFVSPLGCRNAGVTGVHYCIWLFMCFRGIKLDCQACSFYLLNHFHGSEKYLFKTTFKHFFFLIMYMCECV